jgi:hypothetical protein
MRNYFVFLIIICVISMFSFSAFAFAQQAGPQQGISAAVKEGVQLEKRLEKLEKTVSLLKTHDTVVRQDLKTLIDQERKDRKVRETRTKLARRPAYGSEVRVVKGKSGWLWGEAHADQKRIVTSWPEAMK